MAWTGRLVLALLLPLLWSNTATAQNIAGTWRLDAPRSNLRTPSGTPITNNQVLTIRVRGTFIDVSFPLDGLSGMGLPRARYGQIVQRNENEISYSFYGANSAPVSPEPRRGRVPAVRVHVEPDLSGFDVFLTGPSSNHTSFRTSPDGETLTIETVQDSTHIIRVFNRER